MFRVTYKDEQIGRKLNLRVAKMAKDINRKIRVGLDRAAKDIEAKGRSNIAGAGKFGSRWTKGLTAKVEIVQTRNKKGQFSFNDQQIIVAHTEPFFPVFQEGRVIRGRPLLWIPLSFSDAVGTRARDYGPLFRVDRGGGKAPLLLSSQDKQPKYFGKESVTIPKKFRVLEIARDIGRRVRNYIQRA